jgi:arginase family enzyme
MAKQKKELYVPAQALQQDNLPIEEEKVIHYGLQVQKKTENNEQLIQEEEIIEQVQVQDNEQQDKDEIPKSLEERAVEAIIKGKYLYLSFCWFLN